MCLTNFFEINRGNTCGMIDLLVHFNNYYWSYNEDENILVCGGYNDGKFYGQIQFFINNDFVVIEEARHGEIVELLLPPRAYENNTPTYSNVIELMRRIKEYLDNPEVYANQELNRYQLIKNTNELFIKGYNL